MSVLDRKRGALFGLAIGDALGAAVEFRDPGTFPLVTGYRAGGPHGINAGEWTDDTSMALALASSIKEKGWDLHDQVKRYIDWWQNGAYSVNGWCFDIGGTCRTALSDYLDGDSVSMMAPTVPESSGNGSIMRLAPVAIKYHSLYLSDISELERFLEESSLTTHGSEQCLSSCRYLGIILAGLIDGADRSVVLSSDWAILSKMLAFDPLVMRIIEGSYKGKYADGVKGSGWVIASLEASLWAFSTSVSFEEAVLKAVNLGDDADTTGAICGQLAGAYWGESGIPTYLKEGLARKDMIEEALAGIC